MVLHKYFTLLGNYFDENDFHVDDCLNKIYYIPVFVSNPTLN